MYDWVLIMCHTKDRKRACEALRKLTRKCVIPNTRALEAVAFGKAPSCLVHGKHGQVHQSASETVTRNVDPIVLVLLRRATHLFQRRKRRLFYIFPDCVEAFMHLAVGTCIEVHWMHF